VTVSSEIASLSATILQPGIARLHDFEESEAATAGVDPGRHL
jgi:hypothetical protein